MCVCVCVRSAVVQHSYGDLQSRLKLSLWVAGMLHVRPSECTHVADESEDDDEEEQEAGDGMFSKTAVCSKPWLVCLK